jgi:hypothetical protein
MGVEDLDQLGKIGERAGQSVDLVDHDDIDPARPHLGEQCLQGRAVERGPGQAAIIIGLGHQPPALTALAADVGLAGFPLGIERGEGEVEINARSICGCRRRSASALR